MTQRKNINALNNRSLLGFGCICIPLICTSLSAETLGHWRFEQGAFLEDSSGNGYTLENSGITQTGGAAIFSGTANSGFDTNVNIAGAAGSSFTTEAFLTVTNEGSRRTIFGEFVAGDNTVDSGWEIYFNSTNDIVMDVSNGASSHRFYVSGLTVESGKDYYVGASVDASQVVNFNGQNESMSVTFYAQNMSDPQSILQSSTITLTNQAHFVDQAYTYSIGNRQDFALGVPMSGSFDEVRISSGILSTNELLVTSIPEPSTYALTFMALTLGSALFMRRGWSR